jgi:hypothetical protein
VFDFRAHFCHSAPMETHAFGFRLLANAPKGQKRFPISRLLGVALMLAVVSGPVGNAAADPKRFVLTPLAFLEDAAPGRGDVLRRLRVQRHQQSRRCPVWQQCDD